LRKHLTIIFSSRAAESGFFIRSMQKRVTPVQRLILILPQTEAFIPRFTPTGRRRADFSSMTY